MDGNIATAGSVVYTDVNSWAQSIAKQLERQAASIPKNKALIEASLKAIYMYGFLRYTPVTDGGKARGKTVGALAAMKVISNDALSDQTLLLPDERGKIESSSVQEGVTSFKSSPPSTPRFTLYIASAARAQIANKLLKKFVERCVAFIIKELTSGKTFSTIPVSGTKLSELWRTKHG